MRTAIALLLKLSAGLFLSFSLMSGTVFAASSDDDVTVDVSSDQSADPSISAPVTSSTTVTTEAAPSTDATVTKQTTTTTTTAPSDVVAPSSTTTTVTTPAGDSTTIVTPTAPAAATVVPKAESSTPASPSTSKAADKAMSATEAKAAYDKLLGDAGITYKLEKPNLDITVDQKKALDALPSLEEQGMINGKIPPSDVAAMPVSISGALIGVSFSAVIIHTEFDSDSSLDKLHVQVFLLPTGSVSDADKKLCYSFDFTRELFNRTNWDTVTPKDIMLNSPNFKFSEWCQTAIDKESEIKQ